MRFYTAMIRNKENIIISADGGRKGYRASDLGLEHKDMNELIINADGSLTDELAERIDKADQSKALLIADLKLCAPIPRPRQDVICLGINYDEHAVEAGRFSDEAFGGERPFTIYFSKRVSLAGAPGDVLPSYKGLVDSLDYESELGVVLGRDVKGISENDALKAVFGYTVINDISARNLQTRHKQWYLGKSLDGFTPMGPCIVTPDEIGDVHDLNIRSYVNGEIRQNSNTRYMIQTVEGAIAELSAGMTLQAGTIIATGTPAGVGMGMKPPCFLKTGDEVVCEIEKIGQLRTKIGE